MLDVVKTLLTEMDLYLMKLIDYGSDGESTMRDSHKVLSSKMHLDAPHLLDIHSIAHKEPLVANYILSHFSKLRHIDKFMNQIFL